MSMVDIAQCIASTCILLEIALQTALEGPLNKTCRCCLCCLLSVVPTHTTEMYLLKMYTISEVAAGEND